MLILISANMYWNRYTKYIINMSILYGSIIKKNNTINC